MIKIRDLDFRYPDSPFRLRVGALDIAGGERVAFYGQSGCGKTTLAHLIAGIHRPEPGEIVVAEQKLHQLSESARRNFRISKVGFIFQEFALLDYLDVEENVLLPFFITSSLTLDDETRSRVREFADGLGIADKLGRHPNQLSGGEKQRVAIARALVTRPPLIIADEATGNLDPENARRVTDIIGEMAEQHGATLIMVTHDPSVLERFERTINIGEEFRA